jgi:hypothetical protein
MATISLVALMSGYRYKHKHSELYLTADYFVYTLMTVHFYIRDSLR